MPDNQRNALTYLMSNIILHVRVKALRNSNAEVGLSNQVSEEISDLIDVIHNIPDFLLKGEGWDDNYFKKSFLDVYDKKWSEKGGLNLREKYESFLE